MTNENKKQGLVRIYQILNSYSDYDHPLSCTKISKLILDEYQIQMERKAVLRCIQCLKECGVPIETCKRGSFIEERILSDAEVRMVIDSITANNHLSPIRKSDLSQKIHSLTNVYSEQILKNVHINSSIYELEDTLFFHNLKIIDDAISINHKIQFDYGKYDIDRKLHKAFSAVVSPYEIIVKDNHYFLASRNESDNVVFHRIERMNNVKELDEVSDSLRLLPGFHNGLDYNSVFVINSEMYYEKQSWFTVEVDEKYIDCIAEIFGNTTVFKLLPDGKYEVKIKASPMLFNDFKSRYLS